MTKTVYVVVLMYDGIPDQIRVFSTKDKANDWLFGALDGNDKGLYFNDLLEYDPAPGELVDSPYVGTRIEGCKIDPKE